MKQIIISKVQLDKYEKECMEISYTAAVHMYPKQYRELRSILEKILASGLDISEYYETVMKIAALLEPFLELKGTIFYYPYKNINPEIYGRADNLIEEVKRLLDQMDKLDAWIADVKED